jgi:Cation/multidrug efflux pump
MRSFVSFAIKNRYAFFIIFGVLSVLGYMLSFKLPEDIFPNVVYPRVVITVNANYEPIQKTLSNITIPMEQGIKSVEGVTE